MTAIMSFMVRFAKIDGVYALFSFLIHVLNLTIWVTCITLLFIFKCYIT